MLSLIAKNCWRNPRRAILTLLSVTVSFCLLGVLLAMYRAFFLAGDSGNAQAKRVYVHHKVSLAQAIPMAYQSRILQIPGVREITIWQWFGGTYRDARDQKNFFARYGVDPKRIFDIRSELQMPPEQKLAFQQMRTGCMVDQELAKKLGWKIGDRISVIGDIFPVTLDLTLVGIYHDPDEGQVLLFNDAYLRELIRSMPAADRAGAFVVETDSPVDVDAVSNSIDQAFANSPAPTKTETEHAYALGFVSFLGNLKVFLLAITGAVTFTIMLVSANAISMSVRERTREVGILKALGFTRGTILGLMLGEAVSVTILGGVLGTLIAGMLCGFVRQNGPTFIDALQKLNVTPGVLATTLITAALVGAISGIIPAWRSSGIPILDALRYVD
jgi:putative ABC transport system permease protein